MVKVGCVVPARRIRSSFIRITLRQLHLHPISSSPKFWVFAISLLVIHLNLYVGKVSNVQYFWKYLGILIRYLVSQWVRPMLLSSLFHDSLFKKLNWYICEISNKLKCRNQKIMKKIYPGREEDVHILGFRRLLYHCEGLVRRGNGTGFFCHLQKFRNK